MRRNGYLWTSGVNLDTAVRFADPDFLLECKISAIWRRFPSIFVVYMLKVRHISSSGLFDLLSTDLESIPHASTPNLIIPTKFEVNMTIRCRVMAFLSADTSRGLVTLTFALLTLCSRHAWQVKWRTLPPSMKTLRLSFLELRVITFPVGYHWKCVRGHRMRRITSPVCRGSKTITFRYAGPRFAYSLCNFGGSTMKVIKVMCENNARPCVKKCMSFCACAKSRDLLKVP